MPERLQIRTLSDAAAAARSQAHIAKAPLIIATIALFVSITTPEKIAAYVSLKPWVSWFQNDFFSDDAVCLLRGIECMQSAPSDEAAALNAAAGIFLASR